MGLHDILVRKCQAVDHELRQTPLNTVLLDKRHVITKLFYIRERLDHEQMLQWVSFPYHFKNAILGTYENMTKIKKDRTKPAKKALSKQEIKEWIQRNGGRNHTTRRAKPNNRLAKHENVTSKKESKQAKQNTSNNRRTKPNYRWAKRRNLKRNRLETI